MEILKMTITPTTSLAEAKEFVKKNVRNGVICPCCSGMAKIYVRKLNKGMAEELIKLYKLHLAFPNEMFFHHSRFCKITNGEISKLAHWGLVEQKEKSKSDNPNTKTSGHWAITEIGIRFVRDEIKINSHVHLHNGNCIGFSTTKIRITEALGKGFNYPELMNR